MCSGTESLSTAFCKWSGEIRTEAARADRHHVSPPVSVIPAFKKTAHNGGWCVTQRDGSIKIQVSVPAAKQDGFLRNGEAFPTPVKTGHLN